MSSTRSKSRLHVDPADPQLIGRGIKNVWDRIGTAAGIGPAPASVATPPPEREQAPRRPHVG